MSVRSTLGLGAACISTETDTCGATPFIVSVGKMAASAVKRKRTRQRSSQKLSRATFSPHRERNGVDPWRYLSMRAFGE